MISLGLSILLGAGAVLLGRNYMTSNQAEAVAVPATTAQAKVAMQSVLVAAREIPAGEQVASDDFKIVNWPASAVPEGALQQASALQGVHYARSLIVPGEVIVPAKLEAHGARLTLAASIEPGKRAVSILVEEDSGVSGFILPGDSVDVNQFVEVESARPVSSLGPDAGAAKRRMVAKPILRNIKVLAIDQTFEPGLEGAVRSDTVTLEVTPKEALALGAAGRSGALSLSLIGRTEAAAPPKRAVPVTARRTPVRAKPKTQTVTVINGAEETRVRAPVAALEGDR